MCILLWNMPPGHPLFETFLNILVERGFPMLSIMTWAGEFHILKGRPAFSFSDSWHEDMRTGGHDWDKWGLWQFKRAGQQCFENEDMKMRIWPAVTGVLKIFRQWRVMQEWGDFICTSWNDATKEAGGNTGGWLGTLALSFDCLHRGFWQIFDFFWDAAEFLMLVGLVW